MSGIGQKTFLVNWEGIYEVNPDGPRSEAKNLAGKLAKTSIVRAEFNGKPLSAPSWTELTRAVIDRPELLDLVKQNARIEDSVKIAGRPSCFHFFLTKEEARSYIHEMNNPDGEAVPFSSLSEHAVDGGWVCYIANGGAAALKGIRNLLSAYHDVHPDQNMVLEMTVTPTEPKSKDAKGTVEKDAEAGANTETDVNPDLPHNWILFGAPGTGKSYTIQQGLNGIEPCRVTLYPDYGYAQFVGTYKPVSKNIEKEGEKNSDISYEFVPGPFITTLVKALNEKQENQILIIEEVNRADPASVFGDVFQLLDRNDNDVSEYSVDVPEELRAYLKEALTETGERNLAEALSDSDAGNIENDALQDCRKIVIPSNMYIWATMNSADQGVFPMDTAFKRRWTFKYLDIDEGVESLEGPNAKVWNEIREGINTMLKVNGRDIPEDKLLGAHFLNKADLKDDNHFEEALKSKVVMYLFEDAAKYCRSAIFDSELFSTSGQLYLSDLFKKFDRNLPDLGIFARNVWDAPKASADGQMVTGPENADPDEGNEPIEQQEAPTEPEQD